MTCRQKITRHGHGTDVECASGCRVMKWFATACALSVVVLTGSMAQGELETQSIDCSQVELSIDLQQGEVRGSVNSLSICPADSRKVALMVAHLGERILWLVDTDSGEKLRVQSANPSDEDVLGPVKSKDDEIEWRPLADTRGRLWFAFVGLGDTGEPGIFMGWYGGSRVYRVMGGLSGIGWLRWSPNGEQMAFHASDESIGGARIYVLNGLDNFVTREDPSDVAPLSAEPLTNYDSFFPAWSPEGKYIAFSGEMGEMVSLAGGTPPTNYRNWAILVMDPKNPKATTAALTLEMPDTDEFRPTWSPDGDYIAFHLTREQVATGENVKPGELPGKVKSTELQLLRVIEENCRITKGQVLEGTFALEKDLIADFARGPIWGPKQSYTIFYIPVSGTVQGRPFVRQPIRYFKVLPWLLDDPKDTYDFPLVTNLEYTSRFAIDEVGKRAVFTTTEGVMSRLYTMRLSGDDLAPVPQQVRGVEPFLGKMGRVVDAPCRHCWTHPGELCFWYRGTGGLILTGGAAALLVPSGPTPARDELGEPPYPTVPTREFLAR